MKEMQPGLTAQPNPSTLEMKGDIFMPEGQEDQGELPKTQPSSETPPEASEKTTPPKGEPQPGKQKPEITPKNIEKVRKAWADFYEVQGLNIGNLSVNEKRTIELAISKGLYPQEVPPASDPRKVAEFFEKVSKDPEFRRRLREEAAKTPEQEAVRERREQTKEVKAYMQLEVVADTEIEEKVIELLKEITTESLQALLRRAIYTPKTMFNELYSDLREQFMRESRDLEKRISEMGAETPENALDRRRLISRQDRLGGEFIRMQGFLSEEFIKTGRGLPPQLAAVLEKINQMPIGPERTKEIRNLISISAPEDEPIADEILKLIAEDEVATEEFISRLTISDIEDEPWIMRSFYGNINFEKFLRITRNIIRGERRDRLLDLIEANKAFHDMNYIIKRNFDRFGEASESLLPRHFEVLSSIPGVDTILRKYEEMHQRVIASRTRINETDFQRIDKLVEEEINLMNQSGRLPGMVGEKLEDWEIFRARIFGRNFYRILVRAAENIVLSELPEPFDPKLYVSPAQKGLTQILNNLKWTGFRFKIEEPLGGPEVLGNTLEENSKYKGKGRSVGKDPKVRIKTLQGTDVDQREFQGIIGTRGIMATWRNAEAVFRKIKFHDFDGRITDVTQFFLDHINEIEGLRDLPEAQRRARTEALFAPLIPNTTIALGLLVSPSGLPVPPELKEILWEKAAELNPLVLASLLTRLEVTDGRNVKAFEDILLDVWGDEEQKTALGGGSMKILKRDIERLDLVLGRLTAKNANRRSEGERATILNLRRQIDSMRLAYSAKDNILQRLLEDKRWLALSRKLSIANELRIREEVTRLEEGRLDEDPKRLTDFLTGDLVLSEQEQTILNEIIRNGKIITPDLARIRQSHAWFVNDVPFNVLEWGNLGQFYDRETGDLGQFNKSTAAILRVLSNPFGQPEEEILKEFEEAVAGSSQVLGRQYVQENESPLFKTWLHMIYERPWRRAKIISGALHLLRVPTSRAQEIIGPNGPAKDEDGIFKILNDMLPQGILRGSIRDPKTGKEKFSNLYKEFEKEFGVGFFKRLVWAKIRDYGPLGIIAFLIAFVEELTRRQK